MNKKLFTTLTAGIFAVLSSCSGDVVDLQEQKLTDPVQTTAKLTVVVTDQATGESIEGAKVTLLSTGKELTTVNGVVEFDSVRVGEHELLLEAAGYAGYVQAAAITAKYANSILGLGDEQLYIANDTTIYPPMRSLTSSLTGYIYYQDKADPTVERPASGVSVRLQLNASGYVDRIFSGITAADGKYTITGVPSGVQYTLTVLEKAIDGITYSSRNLTTNANDLVYNTVTTRATPTVLTTDAAQTLFQLIDYKTDFANEEREEALVFTFTDEIDAEKFIARDMVVLRYASGPTQVAADVSVSGNTLTIAPIGKWRTTFTVELIQLKSVNGKFITASSSYAPYTGPYTITVRQKDLSAVEMADMELSVADTTMMNFAGRCRHNITTPAIPVGGTVAVSDNLCRADYASQDIDLTWKKVEGANYYRIYARVVGDHQLEAFYLIAPSITSDDVQKDTLVSRVSFGSFDYFNSKSQFGRIDNRTIEFLVQAVNETSESKLDPENALQIKDELKPTVTSGLSLANYRFTPDAGVTNYTFWDEVFVLGGYTRDTVFASASGPYFSGSYVYGLNAALLSEDSSYYSQTIYFSEPMDTSSVAWLVNGVAGNKVGRIALEHTWGDCFSIDEKGGCTQLTLTLTIAKTTAAAIVAAPNTVPLTFSITGLQDWTQGNVFERELINLRDNATVLTNTRKQTINTISFRFISNNP